MSPTTTSTYERVTARIIAQLEAGTIPWQRPWRSGLPFNAVSRREYRGINILALFAHQLEHNLRANAFLTYRQAHELGGWIKGGERGCAVCYVDKIARPTEEEDESAAFWLVKCYTVFGIEQTEGLDELQKRLAAEAPTFTPVEECERIIEQAGVPIQYGGAMAFYSRSTDTITLPDRHRFRSAEGFYSTVLHELVHATGAAHRLNRDLNGRFGNHAYALEELVAELGSAFLAARCGLDHVSDAANYIQSWLVVLKRDGRALFAASRLATEAAHYLYSVGVV